MSSLLLDVRGVSKFYGSLAVLQDLWLTLAPGQILGLIGPNGAGKTTLIGVLSGAIRPSAGEIIYRGRSTLGLKAHQVGELGIIRTFQLAQPFAHLTARECVMLGAMFGAEQGRATRVAQARRQAEEILEFVGLADRADDLCEHLNIPERKKLEIARGVAARPGLLLLDEVMAGLSATEVDRTVEIIRAIRDRGITVIVIEHVIPAIAALSNKVIVLSHGQKIAEGTVHEVFENELVARTYFGARLPTAPTHGERSTQ